MKRRLISLTLFVIFAISLQNAVIAVDLTESVKLPIIMYHSVKPSGCGKDSITPGELESDLKYFKENGYETVTMRQLLDFSEGTGSLPEKPVLLTFDDGYYNNYKYAYPLLKKYNSRAVMSVIVRATDKFTRRPSKNENFAHITWGQLNEMITSGHIEVQNHSYDMHSYGKNRIGCGQKHGESESIYADVLGQDILASQTLIYEMTGHMPTTFVYPYGKYNDNTVAVLRSLGFGASLSCEFGMNLIKPDGENNLFSLKRICRAHNDSISKLLNEAERTLR